MSLISGYSTGSGQWSVVSSLDELSGGSLNWQSNILDQLVPLLGARKVALEIGIAHFVTTFYLLLRGSIPHTL